MEVAHHESFRGSFHGSIIGYVHRRARKISAPLAPLHVICRRCRRSHSDWPIQGQLDKYIQYLIVYIILGIIDDLAQHE